MFWLAYNQSSDGTCKVAAVNTQLAGCMQQTVVRYSLCSVNMGEAQTCSVTVSKPHSGKSSVSEPHTPNVNLSEPQTSSVTVSEPHR